MKIPKIIDNNRVSLLRVLEEIAPNYEQLSIATGYWDLLGTKLIIEKIKKYKTIRLLIGREPLIPRHRVNEPEPDYPDKDFFFDLERLQPTKELKALVQQIKQLVNDGILEVKIYRKTFLHAKCYIFGSYKSDTAVGIIGSSNFTKNGLTQNAELNTLESDHRIVTFCPKTETQEVGHLFWFDELWNNEKTENWNGEFTQLLEQSPIGDILFSPYETYIKTLYELYKEELEEEDIDRSIKGKYDLYSFQFKNVHALLRRLKKYKVAMLADSVGLGKTYTAIDVLKQYITGEEGHRRVEIICPKSLKVQWTKELSVQGVYNLTPVTLQNQREIEEKRALDKIASVALFIIDESHNLKNRSGKRFQQIIEWMKDNPKAHVLLMTATPINNQLSDIVNQILIGTRGDSGVLKVTSVDKKLKQTEQINFYQAIENLKKKIGQDITRDGSIDYDYIKQIMMPILRAFVVRRTRQGIEKEYGGLLVDGVEKRFPKAKPEVKKYGFDKSISDAIRNLKSKTLDLQKVYKFSPEDIVKKTKNLLHPLDQISAIKESISEDKLKNVSAIHYVYQIVLLLGFIPYRWRMYQTKYYGKTRKQIKDMRLPAIESKLLFLQLSIYGILRTMFLKRLESSVSAFQTSLDTYRRKLEVFERGLGAGKIVSLKDLTNIEEQLMMGDEDFDPDEIEIEEDSELDTVDSKKYALDDMKKDIEKEKQLISLLEEQLKILAKDDSKITAFAELLDDLHNKKPAGTKILVFSFYADTIDYLEKALPKYSKCVSASNTAFLSSRNRVNAENLAGRFAPKAKQYELKDGEKELDFLFSTDILSEGQNLQDCGMLINYDLHWNPVRMIQRNGRINRIGTGFEHVYIYNICPEDQLEEYLRLVERLEGKINLIRYTIGTDSPVLDEEENPIEFTDSWKDIYSDSVQKRIEAMQNAEKETDLLLSEDEYVSDLKLFHNSETLPVEYKKKIYNIPLGKWAIMPTASHQGDAKSDILVLNSLHAQDARAVGHVFVSMKKDGDAFQAVTQLQALEWLKTTDNDKKRAEDLITIDKIHIAKKTHDNVKTYTSEEEIGAPIGQQTEILRIMYQNHSTEEDIELVRLAFQTTNILDKQKITKLVRRIMRAKRENNPFINDLNTIINIAKNTFQSRKEQIELDHTKQVLYYVKKND
jgi:superfamily II DNA or RNA helicase